MALRSGSHFATMTADLTNLLPPRRKRLLAHEYLFRLGTVAVWLAVILVVIHGLLLFPSYLYVNQQERAREDQLQTLKASASGATEQELAIRIEAIEKKAKQLAALGTQASASGALRAVLVVPRTGISLHGFMYAPAAAKDSNRLTLAGTAASRESLRLYLEALSALPFVTKAELPISAYAKERDIDFTITLTGSLIP